MGLNPHPFFRLAIQHMSPIFACASELSAVVRYPAAAAAAAAEQARRKFLGVYWREPFWADSPSCPLFGPSLSLLPPWIFHVR